VKVDTRSVEAVPESTTTTTEQATDLAWRSLSGLLPLSACV